MRPSEVKHLLADLLEKSTDGKRRAAFIKGPPGGGKTSLPFQVAEELGIPTVFFHPVFWDPVDMRGIPMPFEKVAGRYRTRWCAPDYIPDDVVAQPRGICVIDEISQADAPMQKACAPICHEGRFGDTYLPPGWIVVATGNRKQDRAGSARLLTHLLSRMCEIELETSLDDFQNWGQQTGSIIGEVRQYLFFQPGDLNTFDPASQEKGTDPRCWEKVSDWFPTVRESLRREVVSGFTGAGVAAKFMAYCKYWQSLPDIKEILAKPETAPVPTEPDVLYAVSGAIGEHCIKAETKVLANALKYTMRLKQEFQMLTMRNLIQFRSKDIHKLPECMTWIRKNQDVINMAARAT